MYLLFENGIRGGISQCPKRISKANNTYCPDFNKYLHSKYLAYWDMNNLYGHSMSQYLPTGGFQWLAQDEINRWSYVLEVDVEYSKSLHWKRSDLPFLSECKVPSGWKKPRLLTTFDTKKHYVVHYHVLKQAIKHGLKLTKIHRVIRFNQSPWLRTYIDLNTNLRQNATNTFERDLYKCFNNSVLGKGMDNTNSSNLTLVGKPIYCINTYEGNYSHYINNNK